LTGLSARAQHFRKDFMYFKQFYLNCLAHASYLIGSDGEAAVVDPQRDVDQYLTEAIARNLEIKYVIETHLHADFVSGHRELAERTGAEIVFGKQAGATFPHRAVGDGDELAVGRVRLKFLETPGHTPESICILITDTEVSPNPQKILTGDTLFVGDIGRPDLAGGRGYTPETMAGMMYDSLHEKLLRLPDNVEVFPAHGAGSMCGRNMSNETSSTIGMQRRLNYALKPMSKDEFVRMMTADLPEAPSYFPLDAEINRSGARGLNELPEPKPLSPKEVHDFSIERDHIILDVRAAQQFGAGHIPRSLNIGLGGQFASWAGTLIPSVSQVVIIADSQDQVDEAVTRLARVGIETVEGFLDGGIASWAEAGYETEAVPQISVDELNQLLHEQEDLQVIDVRRPPEFESGHVPRAVTAPLSVLNAHLSKLGLNPSNQTAVICAGGYRSSAATSILKQHGFTDVLNVAGGTSAWINAGYPIEIPPLPE
jgi:glyoxylase-like metal-dependent hydrolase (beta-lactamase superfamily II)/rhodanese-related sulfurtransferase